MGEGSSLSLRLLHTGKYCTGSVQSNVWLLERLSIPVSATLYDTRTGVCISSLSCATEIHKKENERRPLQTSGSPGLRTNSQSFWHKYYYHPTGRNLACWYQLMRLTDNPCITSTAEKKQGRFKAKKEDLWDCDIFSYLSEGIALSEWAMSEYEIRAKYLTTSSVVLSACKELFHKIKCEELCIAVDNEYGNYLVSLGTLWLQYLCCWSHCTYFHTE